METSMEPKSKIVLVVSVNSVLWGEVATTWWSPNVPLRTYLTSVPLLSTSSPYLRHHHQIIEASCIEFFKNLLFINIFSHLVFMPDISTFFCFSSGPKNASYVYPRFVLASFTNSILGGQFYSGMSWYRFVLNIVCRLDFSLKVATLSELIGRDRNSALFASLILGCY